MICVNRYSFINCCINGVFISGNEPQNLKRFDETRVEDGSNIDRIFINSQIGDVRLYASNSSKVKVHCYGNCSENVEFDAFIVSGELRVLVKAEGNVLGNVNLDVAVPKKTYKQISVTTVSSDIVVDKMLRAEFLKIKTASGNLETSMSFNKAFISLASGDVDLYTKAMSNISIYISTMSGNVLAEFDNIGYIELDTRTMSGDVKNRHRSNGRFEANVQISTMSGNIKIK